MNPLLAFMTPPSGQGGQMSILILQVAGFAAVFYFLFIRPQSQARKRHEAVLSGLKKGDEITTSGGIIGRVKELKEVEVGNAKEVRVTIESGGSTLVVDRSRIVRVGEHSAPGAQG